MSEEKKNQTVYTIERKGHSAIIGWVIIGPLTAFIVPIYWTISKRHYWHI